MPNASPKPPCSLQQLYAAVSYDRETGIFTWVRTGMKSRTDLIGKRAGFVATKGCREIFMFGKFHKAHRLAWFYVMGEWPADIDHKDGDPLNNIFENLRPCTHSQNHANEKTSKNNTSGYKGVIRDKSRNKWTAQIRVKGRHIHLGRFDEKQDAAAAYLAAAKKYFGEFARAA